MPATRTYPGPDPKPTIAAALELLEERFAELVADGLRSPATLEMHRMHVRFLLERLDADLPLEELTPAMLDAAIQAERGGRARVVRSSSGPIVIAPRGTLSPRTVAKRFSTLHRALVFAKRVGWIAELPEWPAFGAPYKPRKRFLRSFAEYEQLFRSLPLHRAEWVAVCLWTGQHAGDVNRMTVGDVDLGERWMLIRNTKNRRTEGLKVALPTPLHTVLQKRFANHRNVAKTDPLVVRWPHRGATLATHCARLGLEVRAAIDLRHTAISWMVRRLGLTPAVLAFAGHSSYQMASRVYAHAMPVQLHEAISALESIALEPANDNGRPR